MYLATTYGVMVFLLSCKVRNDALSAVQYESAEIVFYRYSPVILMRNTQMLTLHKVIYLTIRQKGAQNEWTIRTNNLVNNLEEQINGQFVHLTEAEATAT